MRDNILALIVVAISLTALARPRVGLYGYIWFALMRPDVLAWSGSERPYSLVMAVSVLVGSLRYLGRARGILTNPITRWLILLLITTAASALFAVQSELAWGPFYLYLRIVAMSLLIPILIETPEQLRTLLIIMAFSIGTLSAKFGLYGLMAGGVRYSGGYGGMLSDNNCMALAFAMGVALCWHSREAVFSRWLRVAFVALAASGLAATIMTYSRGAALSLAGCSLVVIYRSNRRLLALASILAVSVPLLLLVGTSYMDRLATMRVPEQESSAQSRLENYVAAIQMWTDYPILGVGFGEANERRLLSHYTKREVGEEDLVIHDTYLQFLVDSGLFACLIYTSLVAGVIIWLGSARQRDLSEDFGIQPTIQAIQLALIAFSIGAVFLSRELFDLVYMLLMSAAAWWRIQQTSTAGDSELCEIVEDLIVSA